MTFKEAEKLIEEKYDNEYLKGDLGWYAAMAIFKKYDPNFGTKKSSIAAEHDILYVADFSEDMTEEDIRTLHANGFRLDSDCEGWSMFT